MCEQPAGTTQAREARVPAALSMPPPPGSGEGLSSPSPLERSPGSEPPSPGPATSPASPDLDPEAVRGALREFLQELRSAQRQRVRLGVSRWVGNRVAEGPARGCRCQNRGLPFLPRPTSGPQDELQAQTGVLSRQLAEMEAERDSATSRARQLQKAVADGAEGEFDPPPPAPCSLCSQPLRWDVWDWPQRLLRPCPAHRDLNGGPSPLGGPPWSAPLHVCRPADPQGLGEAGPVAGGGQAGHPVARFGSRAAPGRA